MRYGFIEIAGRDSQSIESPEEMPEFRDSIPTKNDWIVVRLSLSGLVTLWKREHGAEGRAVFGQHGSVNLWHLSVDKLRTYAIEHRH